MARISFQIASCAQGNKHGFFSPCPYFQSSGFGECDSNSNTPGGPRCRKPTRELQPCDAIGFSMCHGAVVEDAVGNDESYCAKVVTRPLLVFGSSALHAPFLSRSARSVEGGSVMGCDLGLADVRNRGGSTEILCGVVHCRLGSDD